MVCEFLALSSSVRYFGFSCALRAAGGVYMVGVLERGVVEGRIRKGLMGGVNNLSVVVILNLGEGDWQP